MQKHFHRVQKKSTLLRRELLSKQIEKKRQDILYKNRQNQHEDLLRLLSTAYKNYAEIRMKLRDYALDQEFRFNLLSVVGSIVQFLEETPTDQPSWQLLQLLSQYEQIQVPQSQQFTQILIKGLKNGSTRLSSLVVIANLLYYPKYQSLLRDNILESEAMPLLQHILSNAQSKQQVQITAIIHSRVICAHPVYPTEVMSEILKNIIEAAEKDNTLELKCTIGESLSFFPTVHHDRDLAEAIYKVSSAFILKNLGILPNQCLSLILYVIESTLQLDNQMLLKIMEELDKGFNCQISVRILFLCTQNLQEEAVRAIGEGLPALIIISEKLHPKYMVQLLGIVEAIMATAEPPLLENQAFWVFLARQLNKNPSKEILLKLMNILVLLKSTLSFEEEDLWEHKLNQNGIQRVLEEINFQEGVGPGTTFWPSSINDILIRCSSIQIVRGVLFSNYWHFIIRDNYQINYINKIKQIKQIIIMNVHIN